MKKIMFILILIICLFAFGCTNNSKKYTPIDESGKISNVDYKVYHGFSTQNYDLTKRGYYIETYNRVDAPYFYVICSGTRYTGGYSIEIVDLKIDEDLNVEVVVKEEEPCDDCTVTQALTYPYVVLKLSKPANSIDIKDIFENKFEKLN